MKQYIDKSALVAEIERRLKGLEDCHADRIAGYAGEISGLKRLLSFLDTLEVKEVDLEKELIIWHRLHFKKEGTFEKYGGFYLTNSSQIDLAKHFFELGLKTKGE
jgi:hypothetical protein